MKKSKRNDYLLGGVSLFIGIYMILKTVLDIAKETSNGVLSGNSLTVLIWVISVIAGIVFITAGALSVRKARKKP